MAKSRKTTTRTTTARAGRGAAARGASTTTTTEVETAETAGGMGWESGVAVITAFLLLMAILFVDYQLGHAYGSGLLFK